MIIAVEGPSAAGKTTYAARLGSERVIAETGRLVPPAGLSGTDLAEFWSQVNARRWAATLAVERKTGVAVCDTDPLKLHYDCCLARVGAASWDRFDAGVVSATNATRSEARWHRGLRGSWAARRRHVGASTSR